MRNVVLTTISTVLLLAGLALPAASGELTGDAAQCKQLGYTPGTALFLQCLTLVQQQRAEARAQAQAAAANRAAQCAALAQGGGGLMTALYRAQLRAECAR